MTHLDIINKIKEGAKFNGQVYGESIYLNGEKIEVEKSFMIDYCNSFFTFNQFVEAIESHNDGDKLFLIDGKIQVSSGSSFGETYVGRVNGGLIVPKSGSKISHIVNAYNKKKKFG